MANLKEIRTRITSVKSTRQITSAMKMVAAAKLKKAQDAIIQLRPYANKLHDILGVISSSLDQDEGNIYGEKRDINKVLIIVVTSNRGLCGAFNANVIKASKELAERKYGRYLQSGNVDFYTFGKKGHEFFEKNAYNVFESNIKIFDNLTFDNVKPVAEQIMELFVNKQYDVVELIYNSFKNPAVQIINKEQFLPIEMTGEEGGDSSLNYLFEPSKKVIIEELIPRSLKIQLHKALLDSFASEHGARMTAMHMATDNATELLKDLNIEYNKARQAAITNEILEIVNGAEALKG